MSSYRSEIDALNARIEHLDAELAEARRWQDELDRLEGIGRHSPRPFSRFMYFLGRGLGHLIRRRKMVRYRNEIEAARARVRWLEERLALSQPRDR